MSAEPARLPRDLQGRLDVILAKPLLRRAPALAQSIAVLVRNAYERQPGPPALTADQQDLLEELIARPFGNAVPGLEHSASITDYLNQHRGEVITAEQVAEATGETEHMVRVFLREAGDRDWAEPVTGGWRIPS